MKILWLCNIMLPRIAVRLGLACSNKEGWLSGLSEKLLSENRDSRELQLGVCFPHEAPIKGDADGLIYYGFVEDITKPEIYDRKLEAQLRVILEEFEPDIVHIFGTEFPHTLAMTRAFGRKERTLIGIQGLCFAYAREYMADLPLYVQKRSLFRDLVKNDNLPAQQRKFEQRGLYEREALRNTGHITGRTDWDRELTYAENPGARYHFLNETLRPCFYEGRWDVNTCRRHSIFLSQGNYPIKGLHYMLEALPKILEHYPDATLSVAGDKITGFDSVKEKLKIASYGAYIRELIERYRLQDRVEFIGRQDAEGMKKACLSCHVFVSPSAIENSPNSVGEAMLLGVPVVSSDVGGVHNLLRDGEDGFLYDRTDTDSLAGWIVKIFSDDSLAARLSAGACAHARQTHDPEVNYRRLLEIYNEINLCV